MLGSDIFLEALEKKARMFAPSVRETIERNRDVCDWLLNPLARWAHAAYGDSCFEEAAKGYAKYCLHVALAQRTYELAGRYTPEALSEIVSDVYDDAGYMVPYMWAAILIYAFWPSMVNHIRFYRDEFLDHLPVGGRTLELACGHGVMGLLATEHREDVRVEGFDISAPAIAIARRLATASKHDARANFQVKDVLDLRAAGPRGTYQGIIAAMLAEHLQDPRPLFSTIAHHLAPGGRAFFSTALESAQRDHVFEFHHESEPLAMAEEAGLRVVRLISDSRPPIPGEKFLPRAMAAILEHRQTPINN